MLRQYRYEFSNDYKLISAIKCALLKNDLDNVYVDGERIDVNKERDTIYAYFNGKQYQIECEGNIVVDYK